jgi:hypothetical protein
MKEQKLALRKSVGPWVGGETRSPCWIHQLQFWQLHLLARVAPTVRQT